MQNDGRTFGGTAVGGSTTEPSLRIEERSAVAAMPCPAGAGSFWSPAWWRAWRSGSVLAPRLAHVVLPIAGKGDSDWEYSWIPVVGPLIGGALGGIFYHRWFPL
jgi:hypothetical protein